MQGGEQTQAGLGGVSSVAYQMPTFTITNPNLNNQVSRWSFTQGLIVGQLSMVIIAILLIRYVIFEDSSLALEKERRRSDLNKRRSDWERWGRNDDGRRKKSLREQDVLGEGAKGESGGGYNRTRKATTTTTTTTFASILKKTGYDISNHASESTDWLNVVFAQAVAGYRQDVLSGGVVWKDRRGGSGRTRGGGPGGGGGGFASFFSNSPGDQHHNHHHHHQGLYEEGEEREVDEEEEDEEEDEKERTARDLMEEILNRKTGNGKMDFLDPIKVTEADFGDRYPIFSNARVRPADDTGRMRIEVDVDYSDQITLAIDTKLVINLPKPRFAVLPISLSLTVVKFSGTLAIELFSTEPSSVVLPPASPQPSANGDRQTPTNPRSRHQLHFSLHPDFALEASASSLLGSRAKLQDVPKIEQILISRLRGFIQDRFVWPKYWSLTLPNLVPGPESETRGGGGGGDRHQAQQQQGQVDGEMLMATGVEDQGEQSNIPPGALGREKYMMTKLSNEVVNLVDHNPPHHGHHNHQPIPPFSPGRPSPPIPQCSLPSSVEAWRAQTAGLVNSPSAPSTTGPAATSGGGGGGGVNRFGFQSSALNPSTLNGSEAVGQKRSATTRQRVHV